MEKKLEKWKKWLIHIRDDVEMHVESIDFIFRLLTIIRNEPQLKSWLLASYFSTLDPTEWWNTEGDKEWDEWSP